MIIIIVCILIITLIINDQSCTLAHSSMSEVYNNIITIVESVKTPIIQNITDSKQSVFLVTADMITSCHSFPLPSDLGTTFLSPQCVTASA